MPSSTRRAAIAAGLTGLASAAGCLTALRENEPTERTYRMTITRPEGELALAVEPAGDVEDVIQVNVGDDVTFEIDNRADVDVGLHNHATDEEAVVEAGGSHTMAFTPTEEMVGRHELEGFVAGEGGEHHDETPTDGEHHDETPTDEEHHDETPTDGEHHDETPTDEEHHEEEPVVLAVIEVRPAGG